MAAILRPLFLLCLIILAADLRGQSYDNADRAVPDSIAERMKKEKDFLYANDPAYWQKEKPRDDSALVNFLERIARSPVLKWVLYSFLALVIIFAIYQVMVVNDFFIFSRPGKKKMSGSGSDELIMDDDLEQKIREAISQGHYRNATRLLYLKTLQELNEKGFIRLHAKLTNREYVSQMDKHKHGSEFRKLTRIYEFVWYGEFQPSEYQFEIIQNNFNNFIRKN